MEIEFKKIVKQGNYSYKIYVDGMEMNDAVSISRKLTGTTFGEYSGIFNGMTSETECMFKYGGFEQRFTLKQVFGPNITIKESVKRFKQNIKRIADWVDTLPKDSEESLIFEM